MRKLRLLPVLLLALAFAAAARAQITWEKQVGDRTVSCAVSGLMSYVDDCGTRPEAYAYVLVGQVFSVRRVNQDDEVVEIRPEEVFLGDPDIPLLIVVPYADCLASELITGDRWLFFLRQAKDKSRLHPARDKTIVLDYGGPSRPVDRAQDEIETLHRLQLNPGSAILRGSVRRGQALFDTGNGVQGAVVHARRSGDQAQFMATTGADGNYEFPLLAPGKYDLTVDPVGSFQADPETVELKPRSCASVKLGHSPQARIAGHLRYADGSPAPHFHIVLASDEGDWYQTQESNASGNFTFGSLDPGAYVVGVSAPGAADWKDGSGGGAGIAIPQAALYFPNVAKRADAKPIRLAADQQVGDVNFVVPGP
jgi:hypothetical protein